MKSMPVLRTNGRGYFVARWLEDGVESLKPLHTRDRAIAERELVHILLEIRSELIASVRAYNTAVALNPHHIPRLDLNSDANN
ncbi:MAG: hypothetical protein ABW051_09770 [Burkholderiaceae bacterium]